MKYSCKSPNIINNSFNKVISPKYLIFKKGVKKIIAPNLKINPHIMNITVIPIIQYTTYPNVPEVFNLISKSFSFKRKFFIK